MQNNASSEQLPLLEGGSEDEQLITHQPVPLSFWKMALIGACTSGTNFGYSAEYAILPVTTQQYLQKFLISIYQNTSFVYGTPLFVTLGLSRFWTSVAWLAGPLSGLIALPLSSSLSDLYYTRWGRRRPFIFLGTILTVFGMLLFANPVAIANNMLGGEGNRNTQAIVVAVIALWLMNIGLNITQGPSWALVLDLTPPHQQSRANAVVNVLSCCASLIANVLAFINMQPLLHIDNNQALFYFALVLTIMFTIPTLVAAKEIIPNQTQQAKGDSAEEKDTNNHRDITQTIAVETQTKQTNKNVLIHLWHAVKNMDRTIIMILVIFFCCNAAGSPVLYYYTDFVGVEVYHGNPDADEKSEEYAKYQEGVRMGSLGAALLNGLSLFYSFALPRIMSKIGVKNSLLIAYISYLFVAFVPLIPASRNVPVLLILGAIGGILNATAVIVCYAMMGAAVSKEKTGIYVGFLSVVQVAGQMIANFFAGLVMTYADSLAGGMAVGGAFAILGIICVPFTVVVSHVEAKD